MAKFKYINKNKESNLVLTMMSAVHIASETPITKEIISSVRSIMDRADELFDEIVAEAISKEEAVGGSEG